MVIQGSIMKITLDKQTAAFINDLKSKGGEPIYKLTPLKARELLEKVQSSPVEKQSVTTEEKKIPGGPKGDVSVTILRPSNSKEKLPVIFYIHGAGWVMGSLLTHDRLVRELAVETNSALVFVNFSLSPEAKFPTAIEESYAAFKYVSENGDKLNLDTSRLAVAGDSVGGNMVIAVTLLAKERKGPKITCQLLFYPVTNGEMNTPSYTQFSEGPWLTKPAMEWFWNAYEPNIEARKKPLLSPLFASIDQLQGLPQALVITAENDVLRDEGEQYASKLMEAGVNVTASRFLGTTHDFMMLNALSSTPATRGAVLLASTYLNGVFNKQAKKSSGLKKKAA